MAAVVLAGIMVTIVVAVVYVDVVASGVAAENWMWLLGYDYGPLLDYELCRILVVAVEMGYLVCLWLALADYEHLEMSLWIMSLWNTQ